MASKRNGTLHLDLPFSAGEYAALRSVSTYHGLTLTSYVRMRLRAALRDDAKAMGLEINLDRVT